MGWPMEDRDPRPECMNGATRSSDGSSTSTVCCSRSGPTWRKAKWPISCRMWWLSGTPLLFLALCESREPTHKQKKLM